GKSDAAQLEIVRDRQRREQMAPRRHEGYPLAQQFALRFAVDALALETDLARTRNEHAEQRLQHRRLAGAVRTDQQSDLALARVEREIVQDRKAGRIPGDDFLEFNDLLVHDMLLRLSPGRRPGPNLVC